MKLKDNNTASLAVLVFMMAGLILPSMVQSKIVAPAGASDPLPEKAKRKPMVLISVDEEMAGYIQHARELIDRKDYADAIDILQTLLDRPRYCFVPTDDPRRFVSLATKVNEVIGRLPPKGMRLYRRLHDLRARPLFRLAVERLDESVLRDLISRYFHTSFGDDALNLLGGIMFDRGEFSQAARCWRKIIQSTDYTDSKDEKSAVRPRSQQAILLAKIAAAHHFAGEPALAAEAMDLLTKRHPKARATLAGRMQGVAAFTERVLASAAPLLVGARRVKGWPSLAGAPDSVAVMSPARPVLSPRWSTYAGDIVNNPNIETIASFFPNRARTPSQMPAKVILREGRVIFVSRYGNKKREADMVLPAVIHPIVVGKTVLYRAAGGVVTLDLLTGETLWETTDFPLFHKKFSGGRRVYYGRRASGMRMEDRGLWTVTAGGGKVFALGGFPHWQRPRYYCPGMPRPGDSSVLAAFSINNQSRLCWQIGAGEGDSDLIRGAKFLTAPTYIAGRLYVIVEYTQSHHLICLNAENGRLVWKAPIAQMTVHIFRDGRRRNPLRDRAGPPAVSGGKVFVVTNAGVAAAFDADTGRAIWAYQYVTKSGLSAPPNPIVVTKGRAICLPSDCKQLLALRADTGELDWSIDRRGLRDLTAIDHSRLLLSGKGLRIIDAATGKNVWTGRKITGVHGRPAVTTDAVLASGKAEIIRVSLKDFSVTRLPVKQPDAILGNLICTHGKLVAANAAGLSAYFPAVSGQPLKSMPRPARRDKPHSVRTTTKPD